MGVLKATFKASGVTAAKGLPAGTVYIAKGGRLYYMRMEHGDGAVVIANTVGSAAGVGTRVSEVAMEIMQPHVEVVDAEIFLG